MMKINLRWQLLLAILGLGLVGALLSYQVQSASLCTTRVSATGGTFVEGIVGGYIDPLIGGGGRDVIPYLIMIVVLLFRPQGLFGWKRIERV